MSGHEYRVVPAPRRFGRVRAKGAEARAAATLEAEIQALAAEGWEYLRADTLPFEERSGLTQRTTVFHTLLVFRRPLAEPPRDTEPPVALPAPARDAGPPDPPSAPGPELPQDDGR